MVDQYELLMKENLPDLITQDMMSWRCETMRVDPTQTEKGEEEEEHSREHNYGISFPLYTYNAQMLTIFQ